MITSPAIFDDDELERHFRNVGLVVMSCTQLEDACAHVAYAAEGGWDNTDEHLAYMTSSELLRDHLKSVAARLQQASKIELAEQVEALGIDLGALQRERNRIAHSVVGRWIWEPGLRMVHARAVTAADGGAVAPFPTHDAVPTDDVIRTLVVAIDDATRFANKLAGRVGVALGAGEA